MYKLDVYTYRSPIGHCYCYQILGMREVEFAHCVAKEWLAVIASQQLDILWRNSKPPTQQAPESSARRHKADPVNRKTEPGGALHLGVVEHALVNLGLGQTDVPHVNRRFIQSRRRIDL